MQVKKKNIDINSPINTIVSKVSQWPLVIVWGLIIGLWAAPFLFPLRLFQLNRPTAINIPYTIVATVGMVGDVAREIAGPRAQVTTLINSGVDPHLYAPTRSDVHKLLEADIIFYVGLLLEGQMSSVLNRLVRDKETVYGLADRLVLQGIVPLLDEERHSDPHIWMDVSLWKSVVTEIARLLSQFDPRGSSEYQQRADAYITKLTTLDEYIRNAINSIPQNQRVLITAHDAFRYFGNAYGIQVEGIQGLSTESMAGIYRINELVSFLVQREISAIFVESSVHDKNVRALIEGVRAQGGTVAIGGTLFSDAMGGAGSYEGTYIGMLDHNVTTITGALGGSVPPRGLNGKLSP